MNRFCTQCGEPITEDHKFCTSCGAPVITPEQAKNAENIEEAAALKNTEPAAREAAETAVPSEPPVVKPEISANHQEPAIQPATLPQKTGKGKIDPFFKFILFLFLLLCAFIFFYPVLRKSLPGIMAPLERLRGVYTGPVFADPGSQSVPVFTENKASYTTKLTVKGLPFYFKAAVSKKYIVSVQGIFGSAVQLAVKDNLNVPDALYISRQSDSADEPGKANRGGSLVFPAQKGSGYFIIVSSVSGSTAGKEVTLSVALKDTAIPLETIFAAGGGLLFALYIMRMVQVYKKWKKQKTESPPG